VLVSVKGGDLKLGRLWSSQWNRGGLKTTGRMRKVERVEKSTSELFLYSERSGSLVNRKPVDGAVRC